MPLYADDTATRSFLPLDEIPTTFGEVMAAQYRATLTELPTFAAARLAELELARREGTMLSPAEQLARLEEAGLADRLQVDPHGMTDRALELLIERKQEEIAWQETFARAQGGLGQGAARLGLALGASLLDPLNVGLAFVPVVGQARYARMLSSAGGPLGRAGVRARVGAAEGTVGAALAEPLIYTAKQEEQADYEMADSLMNLAFGTIFGGGLHVVGGAGADAIRALRGEAPIDVPETVAELTTGSPIPRAETLPDAERAIETRLAERIERDLDGAIAEYAQIEGTDGGRIINTDLARELSPEYRADRTLSAAVHEPASYLVKRVYERRLAEPPGEGQDPLVLFTAGGTGAGKSTALDALAGPATQRAQIIYDTNMNTLSSAVRRIEQALQAGKDVEIAYIWRDPVDALVNGALPRAMRMGRTVPISEHARTHVGAARVIKELARRYEADERVSIQVIDNSHGRGGARLGALDRIPDLEYNRVREELSAALDAAYRSGKISDAVYRGTRGSEPVSPGAIGSDRPGAGGQPEPEDPGQVSGTTLTAADRVAAATPQVREAAFRTAVGQMADGRPVNVEPLFADQADIARLAAREASAPDPRAARQAEQSAQVDSEIAQVKDDLTAVEEEALLAESAMREQATRLGLEPGDDATEAAAELTQQAERWSRIANAATACLIRGA